MRLKYSYFLFSHLHYYIKTARGSLSSMVLPLVNLDRPYLLPTPACIPAVQLLRATLTLAAPFASTASHSPHLREPQPSSAESPTPRQASTPSLRACPVSPTRTPPRLPRTWCGVAYCRCRRSARSSCSGSPRYRRRRTWTATTTWTPSGMPSCRR
jgi:hypothetical protein